MEKEMPLFILVMLVSAIVLSCRIPLLDSLKQPFSSPVPGSSNPKTYTLYNFQPPPGSSTGTLIHQIGMTITPNVDITAYGLITPINALPYSVNQQFKGVLWSVDTQTVIDFVTFTNYSNTNIVGSWMSILFSSTHVLTGGKNYIIALDMLSNTQYMTIDKFVGYIPQTINNVILGNQRQSAASGAFPNIIVDTSSSNFNIPLIDILFSIN